jgi:hypothetical protein
MANWQQYKQFLPFGMVKLFEGNTNGRCPRMSKWTSARRVTAISRPGSKRLRSMEHRTPSKCCLTDTSKLTTTGPSRVSRSHGAPQGLQDSCQRLLCTRARNFPPAPKTPRPSGLWTASVIFAKTTFDFIYRQSGGDTDAGFPLDEDYAPGTWYTEWFMEETPERSG